MFLFIAMDSIIKDNMKEKLDVIIIGGSYAGLSAAMALGRALREVLVIDGGKPANRFTPHSHNFITHDGKPPSESAEMARKQVDEYPTVKRMDGFVISAEKSNNAFIVRLNTGQTYRSRKLIFATGIVARNGVEIVAGDVRMWEAIESKISSAIYSGSVFNSSTISLS